MPVNERSTLGSLVSATCLQQLRIYTEDLAGRGPILGAGRLRGQGIIVDKGLVGSKLDDDKLHRLFLEVFGLEGTRLCLVTRVQSNLAGGYEVQLVEGACTYLAKADAPMCVYTLGVFIGALQAVSGATMQGVETECQAMGHATCTYQIRPHSVLA